MFYCQWKIEVYLPLILYGKLVGKYTKLLTMLLGECLGVSDSVLASQILWGLGATLIDGFLLVTSYHWNLKPSYIFSGYNLYLKGLKP